MLTSLTLRHTETLSTNSVGMFHYVRMSSRKIKSCLRITFVFRNYFPTSVILISKHLLFTHATVDCAVLLSVVCVYRWECETQTMTGCTALSCQSNSSVGHRWRLGKRCPWRHWPREETRQKGSQSTLSQVIIFLYHIYDFRQICHLSLAAAKTISVVRLEYCNSLLNNIAKKDLSKLQQHCLACMVLNFPRFSRSLPLLKQLHWLPVVYQIKFKLATVTYRALSTQ